jgi:hypothetical protein
VLPRDYSDVEFADSNKENERAHNTLHACRVEVPCNRHCFEFFGNCTLSMHLSERNTAVCGMVVVLLVHENLYYAHQSSPLICSPSGAWTVSSTAMSIEKHWNWQHNLCRSRLPCCLVIEGIEGSQTRGGQERRGHATPRGMGDSHGSVRHLHLDAWEAPMQRGALPVVWFHRLSVSFFCCCLC